MDETMIGDSLSDAYRDLRDALDHYADEIDGLPGGLRAELRMYIGGLDILRQRVDHVQATRDMRCGYCGAPIRGFEWGSCDCVGGDHA